MQLEPSEIAKIMADAAAKAVAPLKAEIADLRRQLDEAKAQAPDIRQQVVDAVAAIPAPKNGKDADESAIVGRVTQAIKADLEQWKAEAQGTIKAPELPDIKDMVDSAVADAVKTIPAPKDGKSFTLEDAQPILDKAVELICEDAEKAISEAVAAIPVPKDGDNGTSVTVDDVRPLIEAGIDKAVKQIPPPKDGVGMAGAMIDRDGNLVITMTNGEVKELGPVVGGPGVDGIGFDDLSVEHDGERTVSLVFTKGERVKRFDLSLPVVIDRGVYKPDLDIRSGDGVTWGGSYWIAQKDAPAGRPGEPSSDGWRLAVKKGRDGKDGRNGIDKTAPVKLESET